MTKNKVMEDLDALLADLQSTTKSMSSCPPPCEPGVIGSPKRAPPPTLPKPMSPPPPTSPSPLSPCSPPPALGKLNTGNNVSRSASSATVSSSASRTSQGTDVSSREPTPPPVPPHPKSSPDDSSSGEGGEHGVESSPVHNHFAAPPPPKPVITHPDMIPSRSVTSKQPGALTANLSELDMLLEDLSSAQFMEVVDSRSSACDPLSGSAAAPPPSVPVTTRPPGERSVDSLLFELESTVHHPQHSPQHSGHSGVLAGGCEQESLYEAVRPLNRSDTSSCAAGNGGNASNATRELEDLMESLSEFKVSNPDVATESPYAQPHKPDRHINNCGPGASPVASTTPGGGPSSMMSQPMSASFSQSGQQEQPLETMLGTLNTDMTRQGIMTIPKGHCAACRKPIVGQVITALGKIWHPEHFSCVHCQVELGTCNFYERDGMPYCEQDYHHLFSPKCAGCGGPILDKCVTALDKTWHPEHFKCAHCGREFGEDGFHEKEGSAYCRDDYFELFAPKCGGCRQPIKDNYISAINRQWHPECFVCQECMMPFGTGSFFDHDGLPYCETHYHARRGSLCAGCHKPITGRCITAMFKKFHPEHFVCAFCLKQLNKGTFKEQNDKPYCHPCFVKLFG